MDADAGEKYGRVAIYDAEGVLKFYVEDMPVFPLLGQDKHAPGAVVAYAERVAVAAGEEGLDEHVAKRLADHSADAMVFALRMRTWQMENPERVKDPD